MADVETLPAANPAQRLNVTDRLSTFARTVPDLLAVICPLGHRAKTSTPWRGPSGSEYETITFADLEADVATIAAGFAAWGVPKGTRLALLVRPGVDFVALVFALLRAGMVIVLVDPGLGRRNLIRCLSEAKPEGFVAISAAQAVRTLLRNRFPKARWNVTVGRRWFWRGKTLDNLRAMGTASLTNFASRFGKQPTSVTSATDEAAIIFTSGSTGVPKGVLYTQQMFDTQVADIQAMYGLKPRGIDLACFPLFALFNAAMGVTTVFPEMDFSRPASADPRKLLAAANDWHANQAFASPAVWRVLGDHCSCSGQRIDSLRQVFSCGAPVSADVLRQTLACVAPDAKMHTPYGATECLPVATIEAAEVLRETAAATSTGAGVCVGRKFDSIEWRLIPITDEPIHSLDAVTDVPQGEIGELIVRGPQVSPAYLTRLEVNAQAKIASSEGQWHRTGDVGYFDKNERFWYCGRKSQRLETSEGPLFTECIEPLFNSVPGVARTALVGIGPREKQTPVIVYEVQKSHANAGGNQQLSQSGQHSDSIVDELRAIASKHHNTRAIRSFLEYPKLPTDVRHNAKINRELLAAWAEKQSRPHDSAR